MFRVSFNGKTREYSSETKLGLVAADFGVKNAIAAKVNGNLLGMDESLKEDSEVTFLSFEEEEGKKVYWHSSSHLLAHAVKTLFPEVKLAIGPAIENGFYYDFEREKPFVPEDLEKIEKKMKELAEENLKIEKIELSRKEAIDLLEKKGEKYKLELIQEISDEKIRFYKQGDFMDLCRGPHLQSTGKIKAIKLTEVASAYWRGDSKRESLQRIYGISFPEKKALEQYLSNIEEAKKRDHRKLGKELDLFSVNEVAGAGLILYHPNGAILRFVIENFLKEEHRKRGYEFVVIPHLFKSDTWKISGHYENYKENMYFTEIEGQEYGIKPMNCPGHILIYQRKLHSYKDLPIKFFELGTVYRHEISGVLSGLFRVRGFTQDDAHIFCTPEQLKEEIKKVIDFALDMMNLFGFEVELTLSTKPEKAIGRTEQWEAATKALRECLEEKKIKYKTDEGGGAFYGPKIDVKMKDALGRLWQGPTIQVDFNLPERFDVKYVGQDGKTHRAVMIHRTVLGSLERFMGILIEHYAGKFPLWLSPTQIIIIPLSDAFLEEAKKIAQDFEEKELRCKIDARNETVEYKVREAQLQKIPYILVIGKKEVESGKLVVRKRSGEIIKEIEKEAFVKQLLEEVKNRK